MSEETVNNGQWAIIELMGRKVVAGYAIEEVKFGKPLIRIDVPETKSFPRFTQYYGGEAIYCLTPVSEQVAVLAAERCQVNPVSVYVPELITREKFEEAMKIYEEEIKKLRSLPEPTET